MGKQVRFPPPPKRDKRTNGNRASTAAKAVRASFSTNYQTPANESEVIAVAVFNEVSALIKNALMTETDLSGLAEWIDVCSLEGDAYVYLPDGPIETKRVPIHFTCDTKTHQITYQL